MRPSVCRRGQVLLGVDFTSAPRPRKPITLAVGRLGGGARDPVYHLDAIRELDSLLAFDGFLREPAGWLGGFDLPFGQSRTLIEHEGWPADWRRFVRFYCGQSRDSLREVFRRWCDGRPDGDKFAWRQADRPAGSSPAMRWTNPPVAWMLHAGVPRLVAAGVNIPGLADGDRTRVALEAYPGFVARQVAGRASYKSDDRAKQTPARRDERKRIITTLEQGGLTWLPRIKMPAKLRQACLDDASGDALDAVLCALQAAWGYERRARNFGLPANLDPLEGWIVGVPAPGAPG